MNKLKQFFKTSFIYFLGQTMTKLVALFLLPLYTANLIPEQLGAYDLAVTIVNLVVPVAFLQIWDGTFRFAFEKEYADKKHWLINNSLAVFAMGVLPCAVLLIVGSAYFHLDYVPLIITYGLLFCLQYIYTFAARMYLDNKLFVFSGVACSLVNAVTNIVLILKFGLGLESLYISQIAGCVVQIVIIEIRLGLLGHFSAKDIDRSFIHRLIKLTAPLCVSTIAFWLLSGFTRAVINKNLGAYENGIFAVANKFAMLVTFVSLILQYAWNETVYLLIGQDDAQKDYSTAITIFLKTFIYAGIGLCFAIKLVFPYLIDEQYNAAIGIMPAVIIGTTFDAAATLINPLFMAKQETKVIMLSTFAGTIINIILSCISVSKYGLNGATISLAAGLLTILIVRIVRLKKQYGLIIEKGICIDLILLIIGIYAYYKLESPLMVLFAAIVTLIAFIISNRKYISMLLSSIRNERTQNER